MAVEYYREYYRDKGIFENLIYDGFESCNIMDLSKAIMIGDREHDIIGAKEVGINSMGVLFGYGDRNELEKAGADFIVDTVSDIGKVLFV